MSTYLITVPVLKSQTSGGVAETVCTEIRRPLLSVTTRNLEPLPCLIFPTLNPFLAPTNVPIMKHPIHQDCDVLCDLLQELPTPATVSCCVPTTGICDGRFGTEGTASKTCHLAPERRIQRRTLNALPASSHGLPRPSSKRGRCGIRGSTIANCSSVNSYRPGIIVEFDGVFMRPILVKALQGFMILVEV